MDANTVVNPATQVVAPQVQAVAPPAPMEYVPPSPAQQQVQAGGDSGVPKSSAMDFFKEIDWVTVGFMTLAAIGLYYNIYYHRRKIKEEKTAYYDIQRQIDKLNQRASGHDADLSEIANFIQGSGGECQVMM